MKLDRFSKAMMVLIFLALMANVVVTVFSPRVSTAQVPEVLIAQATDRLAAATDRVAQSIGGLSERVYASNLRIAEATERLAAATSR